MSEETNRAPKRKGKSKAEHIEALPSKDAILEFIKSSPAKIGKREIARAFNIKGDDRIRLKRLLRELTDDGQVTKARKRLRGRGTLKPVAVLEIAGQDENGELYAVPIDWAETAEGPPPRILMQLKPGPAPGIGDHVLSRIVPVPEPDGFDYTASPIKILPRERTRQLGIFRKLKDGGIIEPTEKKALREWRIGPGETEGAADGELVRFEVTKTGRTLAPRARILERLGHPEGERAISMIAIENHSLPNVFPQAVEAEIATLKAADAQGPRGSAQNSAAHHRSGRRQGS